MPSKSKLDPLALSFIEQHSHHFAEITRGIEREGLRVGESGKIAQTDHPKALGSALSHPFITTDFSEALIELVTPPVKNLKTLEGSLQSLHQFVYQHLDHELIWPASMPPLIDEKEVRIAKYGKSNIAKMKQVYRKGLTYRYGKMMQVIAGIHYNFSLPRELFSAWHRDFGGEMDVREFTNNAYFSLIRNYLRNYWLLIYLFGASPVCTSSSLPAEVPDYLKAWDKESYFAPYATSLRMSGLGYNNHSQSCIAVSRDNLSAYAKDLLKLTQTPDENYSRIGLKDERGEYKQLNENLLQIENEYYSAIRPKQVAHSGERPAVALLERGVEYIEVRCLDVNPFLACGIDSGQAAFIDVFLVFCALAGPESLSQTECRESCDNLRKIVLEGRKEGLMLARQGCAVEMKDWANSLFDEFEKVAAIMDRGLDKPAFSKAVSDQRQKIADSGLTPSAKILSLMSSRRQSFQELMLDQAREYRNYFKQLTASPNQQELAEMAERSLLEQRQIEANDNISFEQFIERYFAQGV